MKKEQPKWKRISKGEKLPCWAFLMTMDGMITNVTAMGVTVAQDAYYLPSSSLIETIKDFPKEESEDEDRKYFIELCDKKLNNGQGLCLSTIATIRLKNFLEKQGEKTNPYSGISFEYNGHIWGMCARDNGVDILLDKQLFTHLEKQGEQKPTAKEVLIKAGLKPYKDGDQWCVLLGDNIQEGICGFGNTIEDALYAFLKDLIANQGERKPAEWREEDEEEFQIAIDTLIKAGQHDSAYWLKFLKDRVQPQPKQEWSALDERNLQGIIDEIEANKNHAPDYDIATYDKFLSWLKSLRPQSHWKLSDEQLGLLETILKMSDSHISLSEWEKIAFKNLVEHLKKLREE